LLRTLNIVDI
jgi:hypothetical protein